MIRVSSIVFLLSLLSLLSQVLCLSAVVTGQTAFGERLNWSNLNTCFLGRTGGDNACGSVSGFIDSGTTETFFLSNIFGDVPPGSRVDGVQVNFRLTVDYVGMTASVRLLLNNQIHGNVDPITLQPVSYVQYAAGSSSYLWEKPDLSIADLSNFTIAVTFVNNNPSGWASRVFFTWMNAEIFFTPCSLPCSGDENKCTGETNDCTGSCRLPALTGGVCTPGVSSWSSATCVEGLCTANVEGDCPTLPQPLLEWDFSSGSFQDIGGVTQSHLSGTTQIVDGKLQLNGDGNLFTDSLNVPITQNKTLDVWLQVPNQEQFGGGAITVQSGGGSVFDSIVWAEFVPRIWAPGSDNSVRSPSSAVWLPEVEDTDQDFVIRLTLVQTASTGWLYRNGKLYGQYQIPGTIPPYNTNTQILIGSRHDGPANRFLTANILRARVFNDALNADQVAYLHGAINCEPVSSSSTGSVSTGSQVTSTTGSVEPPSSNFEIQLQTVDSSDYCDSIDDLSLAGGYLCASSNQVFAYMSVINVGTSTCDANGCSGSIPLDLSAYAGITFTFLAPEGMQFEFTNVPTRYRFQFQMVSSVTGCALVIEDAVPSAVSFDGDELDNVDELSISIGQCDGCGEPEVFGSFSFDQQSRPVSRFRRFQATLNYDPSEVCSGTQNYEWNWDGYAWLRINTNNANGVQLSPLDPSTTGGDSPSTTADSGESSTTGGQPDSTTGQPDSSSTTADSGESSTTADSGESSTTGGQPDSTTGQPGSSSTTGQPDSSSTTGQPGSSSTTGQPDSSSTTGQPGSSSTTGEGSTTSQSSGSVTTTGSSDSGAGVSSTTGPVTPATPFEIHLQVVESSNYCESIGDTSRSDGYLCGDNNQVFAYMSVINTGTSTCNANGCSGSVSLDLSSHNAITLKFLAPEGMQFDFTTAPTRYRFQFQMTSSSSSCTLYISDDNPIVSFDGDSLSNEDDLDLSIGRCDGCGAPEVFGSFTYLTQSQPRKFVSFQATANYDPSSVCSGTQTFTWSWDGYAWLRINTNTFDGVSFSQVATSTTGSADTTGSISVGSIGTMKSIMLLVVTILFSIVF